MKKLNCSVHIRALVVATASLACASCTEVDDLDEETASAEQALSCAGHLLRADSTAADPYGKLAFATPRRFALPAADVYGAARDGAQVTLTYQRGDTMDRCIYEGTQGPYQLVGCESGAVAGDIIETSYLLLAVRPYDRPEHAALELLEIDCWQECPGAAGAENCAVELCDPDTGELVHSECAPVEPEAGERDLLHEAEVARQLGADAAPVPPRRSPREASSGR